MKNDFVRQFLHARQNHPAWLLLASPRAPLVLGCLKPLFDSGKQDVPWEDAVQQLAEMFAAHINSEEFEIPERNHASTARRELRMWMKRGLVVERDNLLLATNSLEQIFSFLDSLNNEAMTSTASRLATVQREIENLAAKLNPTKESRAAHLKSRIAQLQNELEQVEHGEFEVLEGVRAEEGVREIYQLAMSLRSDFRRVEDSYREGDRKLRQQIVRSDQNRGDILDRLLDGHEELLQTTEGQVFDGFYNQLSHEVELDQMKTRLRAILETQPASSALSRKQKGELQYLVPNLVGESQRVIQARARGERDVKGFLQSGLASEHHRVGEIINQILETALDINWTAQSVRRTPSTLPPIAISLANLPTLERLRFKEPDENGKEALDFTNKSTHLSELGEDFWAAMKTLNREQLFKNTLALLQDNTEPITLAGLAKALPPTHDLETLTYWLGMAREAGIPFSNEKEIIDLTENEGQAVTRFTVPLLSLHAAALAEINPEKLG